MVSVVKGVLHNSRYERAGVVARARGDPGPAKKEIPYARVRARSVCRAIGFVACAYHVPVFPW
jgi:hypothetical protein